MAEPVISYPGAKWRFYPYMVDYFPTEMKTFIEPFFGGGSVTLSVADDTRFTNLERMIGGDLYTEIWAFWNGIKKDPSQVVEIATKWFRDACPHQEELRSTGFIAEEARKYLKGGEFENFQTSDIFSDADKVEIAAKINLYNTAINEAENFWKWTQTVDTSQMTLEQRAARMLLVNKISFSGMGDSGSLSKDQFCDYTDNKLERVYQASRILNDHDVQIYNASFEDTMKYAYDDPNNTFIFLDAPYLTQESSGLYGKGGSTHHGFQHEKFAEITKSMPCKWFVTYDDSVAVRNLFKGNTYFGTPCYFMPFTIPGGYTMAGKVREDALAGEELFISNIPFENVSITDDYDF